MGYSIKGVRDNFTNSPDNTKPTNSPDNTNGPMAYVLLNCDSGSENDIIKKIELIPEVEEVHRIFGAYDVIVKLQSLDMDKLREIITWNIGKIDKIRSISTLIVNK